MEVCYAVMMYVEYFRTHFSFLFGFNERIMVDNRSTETQVTFIWETDGAYEFNGFEVEYAISGALRCS